MNENTEEIIFDKSSWGPGEWQNEPDYHEFVYKGYHCFCKRVMFSGHWCGYVELPLDIAQKFCLLDKKMWEIDIDCHGGITYNENFLPPDGEESEFFRYIGFDCAHSEDICPKMEQDLNLFRDKEFKNKLNELREFLPFKQTYKNLEFLIEQLRYMVDQIEDKINGNETQNKN